MPAGNDSVKYGTLRRDDLFFIGQTPYVRVDATLAINRATGEKIGMLPRFDVLPAVSLDPHDPEESDTSDELPF